MEDRRDIERVELKAATLELAEERDRVDNLGRRVAQLEQQLAAQTAQAELLGRRAEDLENRLGEQSRLLAQSEFELNQARGELLAARKNENDLRTDLAELLERTTVAAEKLKAEKAQLQSDLGRTIDERDRLARDLANMKREAEENWASEQVENALLRERVNDVAAEVARLASALEGPNSPIDAILAAETVRNRGKLGTDSRNGDSEFSEASVDERQPGRPNPRAAEPCLARAAERQAAHPQLGGGLNLTPLRGTPYIAQSSRPGA